MIDGDEADGRTYSLCLPSLPCCCFGQDMVGMADFGMVATGTSLSMGG